MDYIDWLSNVEPALSIHVPLGLGIKFFIYIVVHVKFIYIVTLVTFCLGFLPLMSYAFTFFFFFLVIVLIWFW